ncbi:MAG: hypothetical protein ACKV2T_15890 [Kofleriaceae bacterium]
MSTPFSVSVAGERGDADDDDDDDEDDGSGAAPVGGEVDEVAGLPPNDVAA